MMALAVLLAVAGIEIGYLISVNRGLVAQFTADARKESTFVVGDQVLAVTGFDIDGRRLSVSMREARRTLLVTVSSGCPACQRSVNAFRQIGEAAGERGFRVVFVGRDYLPEFVKSEMAGLPGTIIVEPTYRGYNSARLRRVPQAVIISSEGIVEFAQAGELTPEKLTLMLDAIRE